MQRFKGVRHLFVAFETEESFMKKIFASLFIAIMALSSCKKDDTLYYNNITFGNIEGETIISDQGNTFNIVESFYNVKLDSFEYGRVILSCDVLKKTSEKNYDIRLTGIASVLTKAPVLAGSVTPESEIAVDNPLLILDMGYSGGYINMFIQFAKKTDSEQKHLINLVYDGVTTAEDGAKTYTFTLRHNAFEEVPAEDNIDEFEPAAEYVSFPVAGLIEGDKAKVSIKWNTHPIENGNTNWLGSKEMTKTYDWKRVGYEQTGSKKVVSTFKSMIR